MKTKSYQAGCAAAFAATSVHAQLPPVSACNEVTGISLANLGHNRLMVAASNRGWWAINSPDGEVPGHGSNRMPMFGLTALNPRGDSPPVPAVPTPAFARRQP